MIQIGFATPISSRINLPGSKSVANRLLILSSLVPETINISGIPHCSDTLVLIRCLQKIGITIQVARDFVRVVGKFPDCEVQGETLDLLTGDGGTTTRFLLALLARGKRCYRIIPSVTMKARPMEGLLSALRNLGVTVALDESGNILIQGPAEQVGTLKVECAESSQFASALSLAFFDTPMKIIPTNLQFSTRYLSLTDHLIKNFNGGNYSVPVDMSSLAYVLALAALCGTITVGNCSVPDKTQADSAIFEIAKQMGVQVEWSTAGLIINKAQVLKPIAIEVLDCLDLVPALACLCSKADGVSILFGLAGLRGKESNRLIEIQKLLDLFGIKNEYADEEDALRIFGSVAKAPIAEFKSPNDHRMIMAAAIMMKSNNGGILHNETDVAKSFPDFFDLFRQ